MLTAGKPSFAGPLAECGCTTRRGIGHPGVDEPDDRRRRLLRARRERPCDRRPAEQRDELATFQLTEPHSLPSSRNESIADWQGQVSGLLPCGISTRPMSGWGQPRNILPPRPSPLMLAALMIGVQRAISLFTNVASACWPRFSLWRPSLPSSAKRFLTVS